MSTDVIDRLVGIDEGDPVFALRVQRPDAKRNAQASYDALFASDALEHVGRPERLAIAYWAVALAQSVVAPHYRDLLAAESPQTLAALDAALPGAVTTGPYGDYPDGPLSVENQQGLHWQAPPELVAAVGVRLAAALEHTHLLTYRPRDASADALQALLDAGWDTTGIVTLSQLVSFLNFQLRVVAGLTVLKGELR
ncbi:CMD domain protein [Humibacter ginsenosidimutans]|uniref:CMD domain protein n=1 Tax=Humibacter ginsenosidimutans TaxID=2599293 RepID=A0A5B8M458_9MICO|nr:CMD domain protein [Humibacter ginsenosidimutans]QDZ15086.1 CMD domain protein [Humibacter ginsenosidimutans]